MTRRARRAAAAFRRRLRGLRGIACDTHGTVKWKGHLVCSACGRVEHESRAPEVCTCGVRFLPEDAHCGLGAEYKGEAFSARLVCGACAAAVVAAQANAFVGPDGIVG